MSRFLQLYILTFYPPSNLNRDDTGRPKTATVGGTPRLRISSQALKRAWRTSSIFTERFVDHLGMRTRRFDEEIERYLRGQDVPPKRAAEVAAAMAKLLYFGEPKPEKNGKKPRKEKTKKDRPLIFLSPSEQARILDTAKRMADGEHVEFKPKDVLFSADTAADVAMFGRMLADNPEFNREAAVQVAHAITTHRVTVEDDYFTAVDDLSRADETGAAHLNESGFGSGVFYLYACIDTALLLRNLNDDAALAVEACAALVEAAATIPERQASLVRGPLACQLRSGGTRRRPAAHAGRRVQQARDRRRSRRRLHRRPEGMARQAGPGI
jgi:CRISPR system Cascade subunit CasC